MGREADRGGRIRRQTWMSNGKGTPRQQKMERVLSGPKKILHDLVSRKLNPFLLKSGNICRYNNDQTNPLHTITTAAAAPPPPPPPATTPTTPTPVTAAGAQQQHRQHDLFQNINNSDRNTYVTFGGVGRGQPLSRSGYVAWFPLLL